MPFLSALHARAYQLAVGDPASQPYVTGVGGTAIIRYGSPPEETAWNQAGPRGDGSGFPAPFNGRDGRPKTYPGNSAGNGGISSIWRMPRWQRGSDASGDSSSFPCGARRDGLCREVPDVSALAAADSRATPGSTCAYRGSQHLPCYRATRGYDMATGRVRPGRPGWPPTSPARAGHDSAAPGRRTVFSRRPG